MILLLVIHIYCWRGGGHDFIIYLWLWLFREKTVIKVKIVFILLFDHFLLVINVGDVFLVILSHDVYGCEQFVVHR